MKSHRLFCNACDREVSVMITDAPLLDGQATLHDEEVICLEIGSKCTGNLCPLGALEPNAMVARLVRNGLPLAGLRTLRSTCPAWRWSCTAGAAPRARSAAALRDGPWITRSR